LQFFPILKKKIFLFPKSGLADFYVKKFAPKWMILSDAKTAKSIKPAFRKLKPSAKYGFDVFSRPNCM
jgi:hypothetical protein